MMKKTRSIIVVCVVAGLMLSGCGSKTQETALSVSAAASLSDVMQEQIATYQNQTPGIVITANYGASGTLQTQIEEGAPVDLFFSAAQKPMDALEEKGLLQSDGRKNLVQNEIVLIVPKDNALNIQSFADVEKANVVALGEPESVPVGSYAKEVLESLQLWEAVEKKTTFGSDVRQVLSWVESGDADCGIVYATDAAVAGEAVQVIAQAPEGSCKPVIYPAAVLQNSKNKQAAQAFLSFLATEEAKKIFEKYGFTPA